MKDVRFRCLNCGNIESRNLLPGRSTVLGSLPVVNRDAECCEEPRYEDMLGHHSRMMRRSVKDYIPILRA